eukprot:4756242-Prymnesium_polylepis.2
MVHAILGRAREGGQACTVGYHGRAARRAERACRIRVAPAILGRAVLSARVCACAAVWARSGLCVQADASTARLSAARAQADRRGWAEHQGRRAQGGRHMTPDAT